MEFLGFGYGFHELQLFCDYIALIFFAYTLFITRKHKVVNSVARSSSNFISKQRSSYLNFCTTQSNPTVFVLAKSPHKERHIVI